MTSTGKSYWIKSGLLTFLERFSVQLFGFGTFFLLVRALPKEDFGLWVLFMTITALIEVGRAGLLQNALVRYLTTAEKEDYADVSMASLTLNFILTILSIILLFGLARYLQVWWENPIIEQLLWIYAVTTAVLLPFQQCNFTAQANLDFTGIFWSTFTKQGLFFVAVLVLFLANIPFDLLSLAKIQIFTAAGGSFIAWWYSRKYLRFSPKINWTWVSELFNYGKYTFGTNISTMLYKSIDKWMLGGLLPGASFVAIYEPCIKINNLVEAPTLSIASIVFPQSAREEKANGEDAVKELYEKAVGAILAITIPAIIFVLLFPEFIIRVIAGSEYMDAAPLLSLTILYALFIPFASQFGTILDSIGKPQVNFVFVIIGAIINIVSNYFFINEYGVVGAAYGTLVTYLVTFILNQIVLYRMFNIKAWKAFGYVGFFYKEGYKIIMEKLSGKKEEIAIGENFAIEEKEATKS